MGKKARGRFLRTSKDSDPLFPTSIAASPRITKAKMCRQLGASDQVHLQLQALRTRAMGTTHVFFDLARVFRFEVKKY